MNELARKITHHVCGPLNEALTLLATGVQGIGGANHSYVICEGDDILLTLKFQEGALQEVDLNGISNEILLAVVIDRLICFQNGQFSCRENAIAVTHLQDAMHWLHHRTRERLQRGVEGLAKP